MQITVGETITATSNMLDTTLNTTIDIIDHIIKTGTTLVMANIIMGTVNIIMGTANTTTKSIIVIISTATAVMIAAGMID